MRMIFLIFFNEYWGRSEPIFGIFGYCCWVWVGDSRM